MPAAAAVTNARFPFSLSAMSAHSSMRMPWCAEAIDDVVVAGRKLEAGAGRLLSHGRAVELLPWRVVLGIPIAALGLQPLAAFGEFCVGDQDVRPALPRSIRTRSPVSTRASPPPAAASGEALRTEGEPEVPDCRPSPMHGSDVIPRLISAAGGCMFTTSAPPG